jgi:hypothetical protein
MLNQEPEDREQVSGATGAARRQLLPPDTRHLIPESEDFSPDRLIGHPRQIVRRLHVCEVMPVPLPLARELAALQREWADYKTTRAEKAARMAPSYPYKGTLDPRRLPYHVLAALPFEVQNALPAHMVAKGLGSSPHDTRCALKALVHKGYAAHVGKRNNFRYYKLKEA